MTTSARLEEIRIAGKTFHVPSAEVCGRTVVVTGRWIRTAEIKDEAVIEGTVVADPDTFIAKLKKRQLQADVFTFSQRPAQVSAKHEYHWEWDNWAAIPTACFKGWWENLPQVSRKNVRRSAKRRVVVKVVPFDEDLVKGVHRIYNSIRVRDGRFIYGNKRRSSLVEFKRRNGFQQVNFPRYYIPLTLRGYLFVRLRLYRGFGGLLPEPILQVALSCRAWYYKRILTNLTFQHNKFAGVAQR